MATVKDEFNKKGYFENENILNFNRMVLRDINLDFFPMAAPTDEQVEKSLTHTSGLADVMQKEFESKTGNLISIKDPRVVLLQDLYLKQSYFIRTNGAAWLPNFKVILLRRNIHDVAHSMCRMRPNLSLSDARTVWTVYDYLLDDMKDKAETLEVRFEDVLGDPVASMERLCAWIGVEPQEEVILKFIDRKLVHFENSSSDF